MKYGDFVEAIRATYPDEKIEIPVGIVECNKG
ncbi:unnamed protein product [Brugia timori]|uniref:Transposase n=1 Tax=Brugia timori TaxID=42155 RepID=A0A0R3R822_9BILA|nr:unnamed protein product [Brugia timori]